MDQWPPSNPVRYLRFVSKSREKRVDNMVSQEGSLKTAMRNSPLTPFAHGTRAGTFAPGGMVVCFHLQSLLASRS